MQRRDFLKILGISAASPTLFFQPTTKIPKRLDPSIIPLSFETLEGFKLGELHSLTGFIASGKTTLCRSIAMEASKYACVAYLAEDEFIQNYEAGDLNRLDNLFLYRDEDLPWGDDTKVPSQEMVDTIKYLCSNHDLIICDIVRPLPFHLALVDIAVQNNCCLLITNCSRPQSHKSHDTIEIVKEVINGQMYHRYFRIQRHQIPEGMPVISLGMPLGEDVYAPQFWIADELKRPLVSNFSAAERLIFQPKTKTFLPYQNA